MTAAGRPVRRRGGWWAPTLTRRTIGAVLGAFVLVALVLLAREYWNLRHQDHTLEPHLKAARALAQSLPDDETVAAAVTRATEAQYAALRAQASAFGRPLDPVLLELSDAEDGRIVYAPDPLRAHPVPPQTATAADVRIDGRRYGSAQVRTERWQLRLMEPRLETGTALLLLGGQLGTPLLLALPLVLLPLWWAVARGLRPLRQLVATVRARREDDFRPLGLDLRYAELQPLVETVDRLSARMRDALARERQFVHDAAHELRTPLAVVATQAHLLAHSAPAERQAALHRLEQGLVRASRLVEQLLMLARLDGARASSPPPVDVADLLREALLRAERGARERGIALALDGPEQLRLGIDELPLLSIVDNLLGNALLHASGATRILVTLQARPDGLRLRVADDGCGIAPAERTRLFERFARGAQAESRGCGLGLAIVREAAARLGGAVAVDDGLDGRGVAFELTLPAAARAAGPA